MFLIGYFIYALNQWYCDWALRFDTERFFVRWPSHYLYTLLFTELRVIIMYFMIAISSTSIFHFIFEKQN